MREKLLKQEQKALLRSEQLPEIHNCLALVAHSFEVRPYGWLPISARRCLANLGRFTHSSAYPTEVGFEKRVEAATLSEYR
jgi:hypothetical protein